MTDRKRRLKIREDVTCAKIYATIIENRIKVNEEYVYIDTNTLLIVARGLGESILEEYEIKFNDFNKEVFMKEKLLKNVKEIE